MKLLRASTGDVLVIDERQDQLYAGGEGRIFKLRGEPDLVAKVYHQPDSRRRKVEAMLGNPPADGITANHVSIAWPTDSLSTATGPARFVGYLMRKIGKAGTLYEILHPNKRSRKRPHFTFKHMLLVGSNVVRAFSALHSKGYVVGDVNESNILVTDRGLATLVDTDSFQVPRPKGGGFFRCTVGKDEFKAPELEGVAYKEVDLEVTHDLFGLGVLLFQLLMQGNHPYSGVVNAGAGDDWPMRKRITKGNFPFGGGRGPLAPPPLAPGLAVLPPEVQELMRRCFEGGAKDPGVRPTSFEWEHALDQVAGGLRTCQRNTQHLYGPHLKKCAWCEHEDRVGVDFFPPQGKRGLTTPAPKPSPQRALPPPLISSTPPSSAAAAIAAGVTPAPPPPQNGVTLGDVLGGLLKTFLTGAMNGGSTGYASPSQPSGEIHPGRWRFQLMAPVHPMTPGSFLVGCNVQLDPGGSFRGQGEMYAMGRVQPCLIGGRWEYVAGQRTFYAEGMVNGMPPAVRSRLEITGGGNGRYSAIGEGGVPWMIQQLL